jgi:hypothetical protein
MEPSVEVRQVSPGSDAGLCLVWFGLVLVQPGLLLGQGRRGADEDADLEVGLEERRVGEVKLGER